MHIKKLFKNTNIPVSATDAFEQRNTMVNMFRRDVKKIYDLLRLLAIGSQNHNVASFTTVWMAVFHI